MKIIMNNIMLMVVNKESLFILKTLHFSIFNFLNIYVKKLYFLLLIF
jgi:hypothetical protein